MKKIRQEIDSMRNQIHDIRDTCDQLPEHMECKRSFLATRLITTVITDMFEQFKQQRDKLEVLYTEIDSMNGPDVNKLRGELLAALEHSTEYIDLYYDLFMQNAIE